MSIKDYFSNFNPKFCFCLILPIIFLPLLFIGKNNDKKFKCVYGVVLTTGYAIIGAFPLQVAFLLPVFLFPALGLLDTSAVVTNYMKDTAMIIFGMVTIGLAMERSNLQNRVIYNILNISGSSPILIFSGVLIGSAFLAMWLDNTFIVTVMTPIAIAICEEIDRVEINSALAGETELRMIDGASDGGDCDSQISRTRKSIEFKKAMLIAITSAVSVGCKGTLYGSNITITYMQLLESKGSFDKSDLNFLTWMEYNVPIIVVSLAVVWFILALSIFGNPFKYSNSAHDSKVDMSSVKMMLKKRLKDLGPLNSQEIGTLLGLFVAFLLWFTRDPKLFPGWGQLFTSVKIGDATPSIFVAFLLLVLPFKWPRGSQAYETFIPWKYLEQRFPWGVLFMLGGGFAISDAIIKSGLNIWIEDQLSYLDDLPKELILFILLVVATTATEFLNGLACFLILLPIANSLSWRLELHPLYLGLPISIVCTYGFCLPSGQSYMALMLTMAEGDLKMKDLIKTGIWLNIGCVCIIFIMNITWGEFIFNYSQYSNSNNITTISY